MLTAAVAILLCLAFTAFVVADSSHYGRLAFPPDYDDSHSLVEGALRWLTLKHQGLHAAWQEYLERPPHSFLHYYFAAAALGLFGIDAKVVYWCSSLFLITAVMGLLSAIVALRPIRAIPLIAAFLAVPAAFNLIFDFRSECAMAALLFAASCCLVRSAWAPAPSRAWSIAAGLLLAVCLGIKPAMFPYTLGMASAGTFLMIVCSGPRAAIGWKFAFGNAAWIWILMLTPFAFHYALNWNMVAGYILNIAFKESMYRQQGDLFQQLRYHVFGFPGLFQLGRLAWPLLIVTATTSIASIIFRTPNTRTLRRHLLSFTFLTAIAYLGVAVNAMVQNYFGMTFHFLLAGSALLGIAWAAEWLPTRLGHLLCWTVMLALVAIWKVPPSQNYLERTEAIGGAAAVDWRRNGPAEAFRAIQPYWRPENPPLTWVATYGWTDGNTLSWEAVKQGLNWKIWNYYDFPPGEGELHPVRAEILVVPEPQVMGTIDVPCNNNLDRLRATLEHDPNVVRIAELQDPRGKSIRIYRRSPAAP